MRARQRPKGAWLVTLLAVAAAHAVDAAEPETAPAKAATPAKQTTQPPATTLTITGKRQAQQTLIDRKVYKVADEPGLGTASAAEVLNTLPSVDVDIDGNLSLRGDRKVLVLIDGKPSAQLSGSGAGDGLQNFPASMIERIEVMTTPPAQYRSEGTGGVINIITKKASAGTSGAGLQASLGSRLRHVFGVNGNLSTGSVSMNGGLGLRRDVRQRIVDSTLNTPGPAGAGWLAATQHFDERARRVLPSARGSVSWPATATQTFDADFNARIRSGERFFDQANDTRGAGSGLQSSTTRHSDGHEAVLATDQTLRWRWAAADAANTFDLSVHRSADIEREHYTYANKSTAPSVGTSADHLSINHDLNTLDWAADAMHALDNGSQLRAGLALTQDEHAFFNSGDTVDGVSGQPVPNPNITNRFEHSGRITAAYLSWQHSLDWATLVAGLRGEHTITDGWQVTTGERHHHDFSGLYPSLRAEHWLDAKTSLSLGYSRRVSRPDPESLNPFIDYQDTHNLRAGNPNLLPQETEALELRCRREAGSWNVDLTGYARNHHNSVTDIVQVLSADVSLATKANLPRNRTRGLEFTLDGSLAPQWSGRLSGNAYSSEIDATALGTPGLRSTSGLNLKATLDYKPGAADTAQVNLSRNDRRLTPQGNIAPTTVVNLGLRHQADAQTAWVLTVSDLFNGQRQLRTLNTTTLGQTVLRSQPGRVIFFGLNLALGGGAKKGKGTGFEYDQ
jgi:outer membrane receptor for ferrienterochelin and colicin